MDDASHPLAEPLWSAGPAKSTAATRIWLVGKITVSVALLAFLGQKVEWPDVGARLSGAVPGPLAAAQALLFASIFIAAYRWRLLVQRGQARIPVFTAVQLTFAGLFFGQVLPATVGGDIVRGALACRRGLAWRDVVAGIVLDRMTGLMASLILILTGLPWLATHPGAGSAIFAWAAFASAALVCALGGILCLDLVGAPAWLAERRWVASGLNLSRRLRVGLASKAGLLAVALSLTIHLSTVVIVLLIAKGLAVAVPPLAGFIVVPLAILAAAVPISLNGWGIREGVIVAGFGLFGVSAGDALLISLLLGFGVVISVLPGCFTWLKSR